MQQEKKNSSETKKRKGKKSSVEQKEKKGSKMSPLWIQRQFGGEEFPAKMH